MRRCDLSRDEAGAGIKLKSRPTLPAQHANEPPRPRQSSAHHQRLRHLRPALGPEQGMPGPP